MYFISDSVWGFLSEIHCKIPFIYRPDFLWIIHLFLAR